MLSICLSPGRGRACPATSIVPALCVQFEVTGTSPVTDAGKSTEIRSKII
jgi:hypothetical protein